MFNDSMGAIVKKLLLINSKIKTNKVTEQKIGNHNYYVISGAGSMVANTTMNGIGYLEKDVKELAASNVGRIPAPVSHPKDENGNFISASDPVVINDYGIGAFNANYRMDGDRLVKDVYIPKEISINAEMHQSIINKILNGEDIDSSTGVLFTPVATNGVAGDGEEYAMIATNMRLDHDALLPNEVGASTTLMGTGLFANADGDNIEVIEYNSSMPAMNLPLAPLDTEWDASAADKLIREYTNSGDEPSSTYRRYFMYFDRENVKNYGSYKLPFATIIDGRPHAVLNAINNASSRLSQTSGLSDDDKAKAQRIIDAYQAKAEKMKESEAQNSKGLFANAWNKIKSMFKGNELSHDEIYGKIRDKLTSGRGDDYYAWPCDIYSNYFIYRDRVNDEETFFKQEYHITSDNDIEFDGEPMKVERVIEYKTVTNNEGNSMDKLKAALNSAGVNTDGMNDEAVLAAYNKMIVANAMKEGGKDDSELSDEEKAILAKKKEKAATNSTEVPEWFKPFAAQLTAMNADKETALNAKAKQVAALNKGISEETAKTMGLEACEKFLAANSGVVNFNCSGAGFDFAQNSKDDDFDLTKLGSDK